jgi:anti-anti-sigma factor
MPYNVTHLAGDVVCIAVRGRLDIEGTQAVEPGFSYLATVKAELIVIDLGDLDFLASIGIRLILTAARAQAARGGRMVLAAPQARVRKVLVNAGVDQLISVFDDVEAARADLAG